MVPDDMSSKNGARLVAVYDFPVSCMCMLREKYFSFFVIISTFLLVKRY